MKIFVDPAPKPMNPLLKAIDIIVKILGNRNKGGRI